MAGYVNGEWVQATKAHPEYHALIKAVVESDPVTFNEIYKRNLVNFSCERNEIKEKIEIKKETVTYRGKVIDDPVLVSAIKNFGTQCDAVKRFVDNLFLNPRWESVQQLGQFLKHGNFPLTEDGCFLGYKSIRSDWKDCHTGKIDNSIGQTVVMPRAEVTFDPKLACSAGLHVGTHNYASDYCGEILVIVKVNPAHCVSVPFDHNAEKLRCSQYTVIAECTGVLPTCKIYSVEGTELSRNNYFADIRDPNSGRRRRPSTQVLTPADIRPEPEPEPEDYDDDEDVTNYHCDNCGWDDNIEYVNDLFDGAITWCPKCGNELERR